MDLAPDVYLAHKKAKEVKHRLKESQVDSLIAPPMYWGVSKATESFPGTFSVRPETMIAILFDLVFCLYKWGFKKIFIVNAHGDYLHIQTIINGIKNIKDKLDLDIYFLFEEESVTNYGLEEYKEYLLLYKSEMENSFSFSDYADIHAGGDETSDMLRSFPNSVSKEIFSESTGKPIIDIGCGTGADSIYLLNNGYNVISCDFSKTVLEKLKKHDSGVNTKQFDIANGLPFKDSEAHVILASLSLHYFTWEKTQDILKDIERVLDIDGYLVCRLNSTKDINYGAGSGIEIEKNYYKIGNKYKRFFDEESIDHLFFNWKIINKKECDIGRFGKSKKAWEIVVAKQ